MIRLLILVGSLGLATAAHAQVAPTPSFDDPRLQTLTYNSGVSARLVVFPDSNLMLVFHRGETIERVVVSDGNAFKAAVVGGGDTIEISPARAGAMAELRVQTDQNQYRFNLGTGSGLAAAYVVRLVSGAGPGEVKTAVAASQPEPGAATRNYRLKGDRSVRPDEIIDDGDRTFLQWGKNRVLPAVFGIGPGGGEELVAGYMRNGMFVIDRIYPKLVFRFDKEMATATRDKRQK